MTKRKLSVHLFSLGAIIASYYVYLLITTSLSSFVFDKEIPMSYEDVTSLINMSKSGIKTLILGMLIITIVLNIYIYFFDKKSK